MKRPSKLKISFITYKVVSLPKKLRKELDGQHVPNKCLIQIAPGLMPTHEANTLLHEVLHAVLHAAGVGLLLEEEEKIVLAMANGLCQVMKDNPDFLPFMMSRLNGGEAHE